MEKTIVTSTSFIEGKRIVEYLDHISAVIVMGTGPISSGVAHIADLLGSRNMAYEEKLLEAKKLAIADLKAQAEKLGANAVIGVDAEYSALASDGLCVAVNGTAVRAVDQSTLRSLPIVNYSADIPMNALSFDVKELSPGLYAGVLSGVLFDSAITAIKGGIELLPSPTGYATVEIPVNTSLADTSFRTVAFPVEGHPVELLSASCARFILSEYRKSGEIIAVPSARYAQVPDNIQDIRFRHGAAAVRDLTVYPDHWDCSCGKTNSSEVKTCPRCSKLCELSSMRKGELTNLAVKPIIHGDNLWECPLCGKKFKPRSSCWGCGAQLEPPADMV